jgi:transposase
VNSGSQRLRRYPNGAGAAKNGKRSIGKSKGGLTAKIHLVAVDNRNAMIFSLSGGNTHDAPEGRRLLKKVGKQERNLLLGMDRAYEGDEIRDLVASLNMTPVVPLKSNRKESGDYDKEFYKRRNIVERLCRRLKEYRKIFTRYDKLDEMFSTYIYWSLAVIDLHCVNRGLNEISTTHYN